MIDDLFTCANQFNYENLSKIILKIKIWIDLKLFTCTLYSFTQKSSYFTTKDNIRNIIEGSALFPFSFSVEWEGNLIHTSLKLVENLENKILNSIEFFLFVWGVHLEIVAKHRQDFPKATDRSLSRETTGLCFFIRCPCRNFVLYRRLNCSRGLQLLLNEPQTLKTHDVYDNDKTENTNSLTTFCI